MKNEDINITLIQSDLNWQSISKNLEMFEKKIKSIETTDLIILPEMFTTGFTMNIDYAEKSDSSITLEKMKGWAKDKKAAICGSIIVEEFGKYFNRLFFVLPNGEFEIYDKRHLFRMAGEDKYYSAGYQKIVVEYRGGKFAL